MYRKSHRGADLQRTDISGLVSADELRWFWISWHNGSASYGTGNQRDKNIIGHYSDPDHDPFSVDTMFISSYGDTSGFWIMPSVYYITGTCAKIFVMVLVKFTCKFSLTGYV